MASVIGGKALAPKAVVAELSRPGPYPVLRGELALVGLPGAVFTPATGTGLPAVAFAHDWLQPAGPLLRAAPAPRVAGGSSPRPRTPSAARSARTVPSPTTCAPRSDVCSGVRLGGSARGAAVSVDPGKLGLAGHGMGAGSAVLAAAVPAADTQVQAVGEPYWEVGHGVAVQAVATIALTDTKPSAVDAARAVHLPGMHLGFGKDLVSPPAAGADLVEQNWGGESSLRTSRRPPTSACSRDGTGATSCSTARASRRRGAS